MKLCSSRTDKEFIDNLRNLIAVTRGLAITQVTINNRPSVLGALDNCDLVLQHLEKKLEK